MKLRDNFLKLFCLVFNFYRTSLNWIIYISIKINIIFVIFLLNPPHKKDPCNSKQPTSTCCIGLEI